MPQVCAVDVWLIALESDPANASESEIVLSPDEQIRAARFRFESDRRHWTRARSALRTILAEYTGIPAAEIRFTLGPHGKPSPANGGDIEFSLSHSGVWAMVAVTRGVPVGVDIERIRENVDMTVLLKKLGETHFPCDRVGLFSAWTRREAMTKATGGALLDRPDGDFRVCDLDAPDGYTAALALIGQNPAVYLRSMPGNSSGTAKPVSKHFCNR